MALWVRIGSMVNILIFIMEENTLVPRKKHTKVFRHKGPQGFQLPLKLFPKIWGKYIRIYRERAIKHMVNCKPW